MKLTCNICGAPLQMNPNNNGAFCTNCGMNYSVESLRNKLNAGANVPPTNPQSNAQYTQSTTTPPSSAQTAPTAPQQSNNYKALILEIKPGGILAKRYGIIAAVDGKAQPMITQKSGALIIPVTPGEHVISAIITSNGQNNEGTIAPIRFRVTNHNWYGLFSLHRGAWNAYYNLDILEDVEGRTNDVRF